MTSPTTPQQQQTRSTEIQTEQDSRAATGVTPAPAANNLTVAGVGRPPMIPSGNSQRENIAGTTTRSTGSIGSRTIGINDPEASERSGSVGNTSSGMSMSSSSSSNRASFRDLIRMYAAAWTVAELTFLDEIVGSGPDIEVQLAHETVTRLLANDAQFPNNANNDYSNATLITTNAAAKNGGTIMLDDSEMGWSANEAFQLGRERESSFRSSNTNNVSCGLDDSVGGDGARAAAALDNIVNDSLRGSTASASLSSSTSTIWDSATTTTTTTSGRTLGSERRQSLLVERRKSSLFHLWKAHETGLAVSQQASRRSVMVRRSSSSCVGLGYNNTSGGGGAGPQLQHQQQGSTIFRQSNNTNEKKKQLQQHRDLMRRRVSWSSGQLSAAMGIGKIKRWNHATTSAGATTTANHLTSIANRPNLPRMQSDVGRIKSVTFSETVLSAEGGGNVAFQTDIPPPLPMGIPIGLRSSSSPATMLLAPDSFSTHNNIPPPPPSLYPPTSIIASPQSSVAASIPSLHRAHSVHSNFSTRSDSDITESERFGDWNDTQIMSDDNDEVEEKKSSWGEDKQANRVVTGPADENGDCLLLGQKHNPAPTGVILLEATKLLHTNDPDAPLHDDCDSMLKDPSAVRPVLLRRASRNVYQGEGIEVTEATSSSDLMDDNAIVPNLLDIYSMRTSSSFDETMSSKRAVNNSIFRRTLRRSLSGDSNGFFLGAPIDSSSRTLGQDMEDDSSWNLGFDEEDNYFDPWKILEDEYANGYGGGQTLPFCILGTSAEDVHANPHVLSPPLMESLMAFLPVSISGDNFWMKYSMVRDGASFHSFLQQARGANYSILAIETLEGEVFGSFTAAPWRKNWNYFGNGESFLWKMRKSRKNKCHSIIDQAQMESEIDVYPYTGENNCIQLCTHDKIAVGGGTYDLSSPSNKSRKSNATSLDGSRSHDESCDTFKDHEWGFGFTIESDFLHGTTSPCLTFDSPSLSSEHPSGSLFEILNVELWTFTPCSRLEDAEKLELGKLFLEKHVKQ